MMIRDVICIGVNLKNNKTSKGGFVLIEIVIACCLIGIITSLYITVAYKYSNGFRDEMKNSREIFYVNEAFIIIEKEITECEELKIQEGKIGLKTQEGPWNYIRVDRDSDIIISYNNVYSSGSNNILKNVKSFNVENRQGAVCICIGMNSGKFYEKLINLQWKKKEVS